MFEWLINLPVWVQTPLMVAIVLVIAGVCAWVLHALLWRVVPPSKAEKAMLGLDVPAQEDPAQKDPAQKAQREKATTNEA